MSLWNLKRINNFYKHLRKTYTKPLLLRDSKWQIELVKKFLKIDEVKLMISFLKGKKTYLVGILTFALGGLKALGYIDEETFKTILALLGGAGIMTLRAAISTETRK